MILLEDRGYYIYIYLDPSKPGKYSYEGLNMSFLYEPFYVGKGKGKRAYHHIVEAKQNNKKNKINPHKTNRIKKILKLGFSPFVEKIYENLTEEESFNLEKNCILIIGRCNLKTGTLTNLTNGGEGTSGRLVTEENRQKYINAFKKVDRTGENNSNYGNYWTEEQRRRVREITYTPELKKLRQETTKKIWESRSAEERTRIALKSAEKLRGKPRKGIVVTKGKTFEEYFGEEKAREIKQKIGIASKKIKTIKIDLYLLLDMYFQGKTNLEMSKVFGVGSTAIYSRLKNIGVNTNLMHYKKRKQLLNYFENMSLEDKQTFYSKAEEMMKFLED